RPGLFRAGSGAAESEREAPGLERLAVRPEDAFEQINLEDPEALERLGELHFQDAIRGGVLEREIGRRRHRLAALNALRLEIVWLDASLQSRLIDVARELDAHGRRHQDV